MRPIVAPLCQHVKSKCQDHSASDCVGVWLGVWLGVCVSVGLVRWARPSRPVHKLTARCFSRLCVSFRSRVIHIVAVPRVNTELKLAGPDSIPAGPRGPLGYFRAGPRRRAAKCAPNERRRGSVETAPPAAGRQQAPASCPRASEPGSLGAWEPGSLGAWEPGSLGAWEPGSLGAADPSPLQRVGGPLVAWRRGAFDGEPTRGPRTR
ncbi:unnamed protein product [Arctogadus glacialis]